MRRRALVRAVAGLSLTGLAGCSGDSGSDATPGENEILAGPDRTLTYEPATITVSTGTTVTWRFASPSHNVSCVPDHSDRASLPDGAEPFASYEGEGMYATDAEGETFEHTFEVPGEYRYVCIPHARSGMEGTVTVEE